MNIRKNKSTRLIALLLISSPILAEDLTFLNSPLFSDSHLDLSTRSMWKYMKEDTLGDKYVQSAWGQGITLDYKSGYLADMLGFDASYYGVIKLAASDYFAGRSVLYNRTDNTGKPFDKRNAEGFNKIGQLYGKFKLGDDSTNLHAYSGWKRLNKFGAISGSSRAIPATYLGWSSEANLNALRLRGAYLTRYSDRDSPNKVKFLTHDRKKEINYIATGELAYKSDSLNALYFYGASEDYLQRQGLELSMDLTDSIKIGSQIYINNALKDWKSMSDKNKAFDNDAYHYALDTAWSQGDLTTKVGIAYTQAKKSDGLGYFQWHMSRNSRGNFNSMADAGTDYVKDGERTIALAMDYKFTPELTAGILTNYATLKYRGITIHEGEVNLFSQWTPKTKPLKGLSVFTIVGPGWTYKNNSNTPTLDSKGNYQRAHSLSADIVIDYKFNLF